MASQFNPTKRALPTITDTVLSRCVAAEVIAVRNAADKLARGNADSELGGTLLMMMLKLTCELTRK